MSYIKTIITTNNGINHEGPFFAHYMNVDQAIEEVMNIPREDIADIKWKVVGSHEKKQLQVVSYLKTKYVLDSTYPFIPADYSVDEQREWNKQFMFNAKSINTLIKLYNVDRFYNHYESGIKFPSRLMAEITSASYYRYAYNFSRIARSMPEMYAKCSSISDVYQFFTIKTAKGKVRLVCSNKLKELKESSKMLKDIMMFMCKIDNSMLGVGKGIDKSIDILHGSDIIVKIDLKDFFNSVSFQALKKGLEKQGFNPELAKMIGLACTPHFKTQANSFEMKKTLANKCPEIGVRRTWQGLETSSIAAYIALQPIYQKIRNYCETRGMEPVIYVDDLAIGLKGKTKAEARKVKEDIIKIIQGNSKLRINEKKSKLLYGNKKFYCNINTELKQLPNESSAKIKATIHSAHAKKYIIDAEKNKITDTLKIQQIITGKLNYMKMISEEQYDRIVKHWKYSGMLKEIGVI